MPRPSEVRLGMETASAESYARFLSALGHRVFRTPNAYWYDVQSRFYLATPHHREYEISEAELRGLFRATQCIGVRFAAPLTARGKVSYQIVCDERRYGLDTLSPNQRSKVRRGLRRCAVGPADMEILREQGFAAHTETLARQGRESAWDESRWQRFWNAAREAPGFEGWAAWVDERLAAFLVTVTFEDSVEFLLARSCREERGAYPNNALIYFVAEEMLVRRGLREITFGLESLEPVGPLDEFKFGLGFRPRPLRQRVVFHPVLRAVLRVRPARSLLEQWLERKSKTDVFYRKAVGLLRFAVEGGW